jgi:hypothetical protein
MSSGSRAFGLRVKAAWDSRRLTEAVYHSGGVIATAR